MPRPTDQEMLAIAKKVLTGEMKREEVAHLPMSTKAYVGITLMLAARYHVRGSNVVEGSLAKALVAVTQSGLPISHASYVYNEPLREKAGALGLYFKAKPGMREVKLNPPPEMERLIQEHKDERVLAEYFEGVVD